MQYKWLIAHCHALVVQAMHHPFTAPCQEYLEGKCDARQATALAYDMVYNGSEIGGASPTLLTERPALRLLSGGLEWG